MLFISILLQSIIDKNTMTNWLSQLLIIGSIDLNLVTIIPLTIYSTDKVNFIQPFLLSNFSVGLFFDHSRPSYSFHLFFHHNLLVQVPILTQWNIIRLRESD